MLFLKLAPFVYFVEKKHVIQVWHVTHNFDHVTHHLQNHVSHIFHITSHVAKTAFCRGNTHLFESIIALIALLISEESIM